DGDGTPGATEPGLPGVIVFIDLNGDGQFNPPSPGSPGEPVTLSGLNGNYDLKVPIDGDFQVLEVVPPGFTMTTPVPGKVTVSGGAVVTGPSFGDKQTTPAQGGVIHGVVFSDPNGDGQQQSTEPGLPGILVFADINGDGHFN